MIHIIGSAKCPEILLFQIIYLENNITNWASVALVPRIILRL